MIFYNFLITYKEFLSAVYMFRCCWPSLKLWILNFWAIYFFQCLKPKELLKRNEINSSSLTSSGGDVTREDFIKLCPSILQQIDSKHCIHYHRQTVQKQVVLDHHDHAPEKSQGWYPVRTQRCFNVHLTSITSKKRWIDVQITSRVSWVLLILIYWTFSSSVDWMEFVVNLFVMLKNLVTFHRGESLPW